MAIQRRRVRATPPTGRVLAKGIHRRCADRFAQLCPAGREGPARCLCESTRLAGILRALARPLPTKKRNANSIWERLEAPAHKPMMTNERP